MAPVTKQGDKLRRITMPDAVKVHSFTAVSDFQAFQLNYDWNGWGNWRPEPNWVEHFYTATEVEEQGRYLEVRNRR